MVDFEVGQLWCFERPIKHFVTWDWISIFTDVFGCCFRQGQTFNENSDSDGRNQEWHKHMRFLLFSQLTQKSTTGVSHPISVSGLPKTKQRSLTMEFDNVWQFVSLLSGLLLVCQQHGKIPLQHGAKELLLHRLRWCAPLFPVWVDVVFCRCDGVEGFNMDPLRESFDICLQGNQKLMFGWQGTTHM